MGMLPIAWLVRERLRHRYGSIVLIRHPVADFTTDNIEERRLAHH